MFSVHRLTLTPDVSAALQQFSRDASAVLGRTVGGSALIRALIRQVSHQGPRTLDALFLEVEKELNASVMWREKQGVK